MVSRILRRYGGQECGSYREYIANQLKEDEMGEQMAMSEIGPFTDGKQQVFARPADRFHI